MKRTGDECRWDFVRGWLRKAEGDLSAAEYLLTRQQEDYFTAAFHAQQAAEKLLKAFLVRHQVLFPKTHDIERLLELAAKVDPTLKTELAAASTLTPFGVEFRYPGEEVADFDAATYALEQAKRVRTAILDRLKDYLSRRRLSGPPS